MGGLFLGWYNGKSTTVSSVKGYLGYGVGTYNLNGGLLTGGAGGGTYPSGLECVGVGGQGYFNQSGGTNYCTSFLNVGGPGAAAQYIAGPFPGTPGSGSYTLSGGLVTCPTVWTISGGEADEYVGSGGAGLFTQTGGSNIASAISLGGRAQTASSAYVPTIGTYNLNGGLLQTSLVLVGNAAQPSESVFNWTGGTLQAGSQGLLANVPITLAATSMCTLDMNGKTVNLTSLTTTPGLTDFNFADPTTGNDLLSVPGGGLTVNPNTYHQLRHGADDAGHLRVDC